MENNYKEEVKNETMESKVNEIVERLVENNLLKKHKASDLNSTLLFSITDYLKKNDVNEINWELFNDVAEVVAYIIKHLYTKTINHKDDWFWNTIERHQLGLGEYQGRLYKELEGNYSGNIKEIYNLFTFRDKNVDEIISMLRYSHVIALEEYKELKNNMVDMDVNKLYNYLLSIEDKMKSMGDGDRRKSYYYKVMFSIK